MSECVSVRACVSACKREGSPMCMSDIFNNTASNLIMLHAQAYYTFLKLLLKCCFSPSKTNRGMLMVGDEIERGERELVQVFVNLCGCEEREGGR